MIFVGGFEDGTCDQVNPETEATVNSSTEADPQVTYTFQENTTFTLGAKNITDEDPPYNPSSWPWYSQSRYNNRGRLFYYAVSHTF